MNRFRGHRGCRKDRSAGTSSTHPRKLIEMAKPLVISILEGRSGHQKDRDYLKIGCHTRANPDCCNRCELNSSSSQDRGRERERDCIGDSFKALEIFAVPDRGI